ncbi:MAG: DUF541 domain-containing protein [Nitrososphaeria archaeon]|nr:DUF541 domain-containing protein [Nitrososphaeria archaeon]NDB51415.1 DUF541 domain-containing protein [Nitrosopumilaceae archaeon]NDB87416.1 DUF541 domain-containing protein [Nitrososphaerota archaeon]NDB46942.1 DUF541 domain-containing protein [Nitrososphaeria archaeon]NDB90028.1 DUF541 domain-containing protein [Nitrososphaerota archaeon]
MNKTITIAAAIGVVLALGFSLGAIPTGLNAQAQTEPTPFPSREKTISSSGQATSFVEPDRLNINFGVEVQKPTAKEALDENSDKMNEVIDAIKSAGINSDEITTSQFSIYPVYESYQEKETGIYKQKLTGYSVSNIIQVKTPKMDLASEIIDAAVGAGVNRVDNVWFSLSDKKQQQVSDDLLAEAIKNAQSKAEKALVPLNYKIIGVKYVSLDGGYYPPPMPYYGAMDAGVAKSATPIFSSDQQVSASATVVFLIGSN